MEKEYYTFPAAPVYHETIRRLQRQDPADAETVFNPLIQALLENTHFVRLLAETIAAQNTAEHTAIRKETVEAIAAIPTPDVSGQIGTHNSDANAHSAIRTTITNHQNNKSNPHGVTAAQAGADAAGSAAAVQSSLNAHTGNKSNPHGVTAAQVGAAASGHTHTAADVGAAAAGHTHTAAQVGAAAVGHTHTAAQVGARPSSWTPTAADVGAATAGHTHTAAQVGARPSSWMPTAAQVGAAAAGHTHTPAQAGVTIQSNVPSSLTNGQVVLVYV